MPSVLFVCTANRFRSALAAGIFAKAIEEEEKVKLCSWDIGPASDWQIASAGHQAISGQPVLPDVLETASSLGIDLSAHRSRRVDELNLPEYDLILVMEELQRELLRSRYPGLKDNIYLLSRVVENEDYDIPDAHNSPQSVMGVCAILNELIRHSLSYICVLAIALHNKRVIENDKTR
jgi:protein-tyrosine-phosphatase